MLIEWMMLEKKVSKLENKIMDACNDIGNSVKKEEIHKMVEATKAFTALLFYN